MLATLIFFLGILRQILAEMQQTHKMFDARLKNLERKIDEGQGFEGPSKKRQKVSPSPEIRVSKIWVAVALEL